MAGRRHAGGFGRSATGSGRASRFLPPPAWACADIPWRGRLPTPQGLTAMDGRSFRVDPLRPERKRYRRSLPERPPRSPGKTVRRPAGRTRARSGRAPPALAAPAPPCGRAAAMDLHSKAAGMAGSGPGAGRLRPPCCPVPPPWPSPFALPTKARGSVAAAGRAPAVPDQLQRRRRQRLAGLLALEPQTRQARPDPVWPG